MNDMSPGGALRSLRRLATHVAEESLGAQNGSERGHQTAVLLKEKISFLISAD